jgi:hypothetical protein
MIGKVGSVGNEKYVCVEMAAVKVTVKITAKNYRA